MSEDNVIWADFGARRRLPGRPGEEPADPPSGAPADDPPPPEPVEPPSGPGFDQPPIVPEDARAIAAREDEPAVLDSPYRGIGDVLRGEIDGLSDPGRVKRGRDYQSDGRVVALERVDGVLFGDVQGSALSPFRVELEFPLVDGYPELAADVERLERMTAFGDREGADSARLALVRRILHGMPPPLCSCPDGVLVCKHIVACLEETAERMERDPDIVRRLIGAPEPEGRRGTLDEAAARRFWEGGEIPPPPEPSGPPVIGQGDPLLLGRAMRAMSHSTMEQLDATYQLECIYEHLEHVDLRPSR